MDHKFGGAVGDSKYANNRTCCFNVDASNNLDMDVLAGGTVDDFQIADQGGYDTVFVEYANLFSEAVLFSFDAKNMEYKFTALQNYETCIK